MPCRVNKFTRCGIFSLDNTKYLRYNIGMNKFINLALLTGSLFLPWAWPVCLAILVVRCERRF